MTAVDLDANLIPGIAAADWQIGTRLWECRALLRGAVEVDCETDSSGIDTADNTGVLIERNYYPRGSGHTAVFFGADVVRLQFNAAGELFCIWVFGGYRGKAFGRIGVGSSLADVRLQFPLFYDSGDEMYYPDSALDAAAPTGIAFCAGPPEPQGDTQIYGICIHDWKLMRRLKV